jgi:hypothetical protein
MDRAAGTCANRRHHPCLRALEGEWVQLPPIENRVLIYHCNTVVREIEPTVKDLPEQNKSMSRNLRRGRPRNISDLMPQCQQTQQGADAQLRIYGNR